MTDRQTAIVCDDHPLFRSGVVACISSMGGIDVVAMAADGKSCIAKLEIYTPTILIADLAMPLMSGFEVLEWARIHQPKLRTFILSMHTDMEYVLKARELGAVGFLAKEDAEAELLNAILSKPDTFYTSESVGRGSRRNILVANSVFSRSLQYVSKAELKVLALLTENLTSRQIADRLHISVRTVQAHRVSLSDKLGVKGPNKLLELALNNRAEILSRKI